ncbi:hypothetical protein [Clostridium argentinense]|nr:hypothetical protein [Clostridium argentinense]
MLRFNYFGIVESDLPKLNLNTSYVKVQPLVQDIFYFYDIIKTIEAKGFS